MQEFIGQFHFLRPYWLLAVIPAIALGIWLWRDKRRSSRWQSLIQWDLLPHLLEGRLGKSSRLPLIGLMAGWIIACVALAGPTWQRLPQPVHQSEAAVVMLFDMSPSMLAQDLKPSRLQRARFKIRDYLEERPDGMTALVAYAGEAHTVSPLTDDTDTIANLLPALHPDMMPLPGSNVEMAVDQALGLFAAAGVDRGELLLITDEVATDAFPDLRDKLADSRFRLSILGVGTPAGAPIPRGDGGFARDSRNDIVIAKLNRQELQTLSSDLGGAYADLSADGRDIESLVAHNQRQERLYQQQRLLDREFDVWQDRGQWLVLLLLPLAALAFRRGWLLNAALLGFLGLGIPTDSYALEWRDLWQRGDQQGLAELERDNPEAAASKFESHDWRGTALYRAEDYSGAARAFAQGDAAVDHYNRGNALARAGELQAALEAYEQALAQQPDFSDAEFNAQLIRDLLDQQQQNSDNTDNKEDQQEQQTAQDRDNQPGKSSRQDKQNDSGEGDSQQPQQSESQQSGDDAQGEPSVDEQTARELSDREGDPQDNSAGESAEAQPQQSDDRANQNGQEAPNSTNQEMEPRQRSEETEQQQALQQWLRQVPDDPSGLLRRKFEYEHRKRRYKTGDWLPQMEGSEQRW